MKNVPANVFFGSVHRSIASKTIYGYSHFPLCVNIKIASIDLYSRIKKGDMAKWIPIPDSYDFHKARFRISLFVKNSCLSAKALYSTRFARKIHHTVQR